MACNPSAWHYFSKIRHLYHANIDSLTAAWIEGATGRGVYGARNIPFYDLVFYILRREGYLWNAS